jgi:hypothetical protein
VDWRSAEIVLDVAVEADTVAMGVLLAGAGVVSVADLRLDRAADGIAPTQPPPPDGWLLSADAQGDEVSVECGDGGEIVVFRRPPGSGSHGAISRVVSAVGYRGRPVRLRAELLGEDVETSAGLWMTLVDERGSVLAFDNMMERSLRGTFGWTPAEIVLGASERATWISYGVMLAGGGTVRATSLQLEAGEEGAAVTGTYRPAVDGWLLSAHRPSAYEVADEPDERATGARQIVLRTIGDPGSSAASLTRWALAGEYRGREVRFVADLRGEDVESGTSLWLSADNRAEAGRPVGALEVPMLRGTFGWCQTAVSAVVPPEAEAVLFGVLLEGRGVVRIANARVEVVR